MGTVFRSSAPLYFEARFRVHNFEKSGTTKASIGFWTQDLSMGTGINKVMLANPGHDEMIENDIIELCHAWGGEAGQHISGFQEWCDGNLGDVNTQFPPVGTDYGQYHTYACLLVPATAANGWNGYRAIYFDGVPMTSTCWVGNQTYRGVFPQTKESMGSYRFSAIDRVWEVLILGTCQGGVCPMDVDYVRVYGVSESSVKVVKSGIPSTPEPPELTAVAGDSQVTLTWSATARIYELYRGTTPDGQAEKPIARWISTSAYTDKGLANGTTYYYRVTAVNGLGASAKSNEASARPAGHTHKPPK